MDRTFTVRAGGGWFVRHDDGDEIDNFLVAREDDRYFHIQMLDDTLVGKDGQVVHFRVPAVCEHATGHDKIGDVVVQLRKNPHTKRWMVQVEDENVYDAPDLPPVPMPRAVRSSVDNIAQSTKRPIQYLGQIRSNTRRIIGLPIKVHYVIAPWSPQSVDQMLDVFHFVGTQEAMGLATFLKALQTMPAEPAQEIFEQIRTPPENGNGNH